ncbi:N,N-dimethylaniline monooxygenase [Aureococcus anophagefferens]|nr:N,N-dimethylaniline monooxygenase [Aureococcus anophagefferens]
MAAVSSADLLYDPQVWVYFAILGWSLRGQVQRATRRGLAAACALVGITWFYIFRFTLAYKNGGGANLFDDAYADVLRGPHARSSCQLLTWVVVAFTLAPSRDVLWTGMLGAMSAAYSLSPPDLAPPPRVATLDAACALASLACVAALPRLLDAPAAFGAVLKALHALLVLPRYAPALPGSVDATVFYGAVAALAGARDAPSAGGLPGYVTAFSDFRLGRGAESHLALDAYVAYLERYVDRFGLARKIEFGTTVRAVARAGGRYAVETEAGGVARTRSFDRVAVCSGLHTHPKTPALPGRFRGDVFHSRDYASPGRFAGRRVVVVGAGETAFDVAHGAASAGARRLGMLVLGGSSKGWNQWVGASVHMDWTEGRKHIVNKATKCMPLLNRSAKGPAWNPYRFWDSAASRVAVGVDLLDKYEPVKFESDGFPFLFGAGAGDDPLPGRHFLVDDAEPDLAFIGFVRPNVGAIPPMAELQAMWWIARLRGDVSDGPGDYALTDRRLDYGVDYGLYMFALAKEMGAAPSLAKWLLAGRPDVVVAAAFGQAHAPLFRLDGPFARRDAADVCGGELLEPIRMRGILNVVFLGNVLFFGVVNAFRRGRSLVAGAPAAPAAAAAPEAAAAPPPAARSTAAAPAPPEPRVGGLRSRAEASRRRRGRRAAPRLAEARDAADAAPRPGKPRDTADAADAASRRAPPPDEPSDDDDFDEAAALRAAKRLKVSQLAELRAAGADSEDGLKADLVARLVGVRKRAHAADVGARKRARA